MNQTMTLSAMSMGLAWNAGLYDEKHAFVSKFGEELITVLNPQKDEFILDLGCGTGDLTQQIALSGAHVEGMDASSEMISQARKKYPQIKFWLGNACDLGVSERYDAIFSNAVLHWIKEQERVLDSIWQALKANGRFVAEFGGVGNVSHIIQAVIDCLRKAGQPVNEDDIPWYFPSIGEYTSLMEKHGFLVQYALYFERPTILEDGEKGMDNWLEMFVIRLFEKITPEQKQALIEQVKDELRGVSLKDGEWIADYKRIRVAGIKKV